MYTLEISWVLSEIEGLTPMCSAPVRFHLQGLWFFSRIALSGVSSEAATWRLSHDKRNQKFFQWQLNVEVLVTWQVPSPNDEKLPEPLLLYWISLQRYGVARYLSPNICHVHCPTSMPQFLQYSCGRCAPEICIFLDLGKARTGTGPKSQTPQWFSVSKMPSNGGYRYRL